MTYHPEIHHRKSLRLKQYDYAQSGAYFITICTHNHKCLFGKIIDGKMVLNDAGEITRHSWLEMTNHFPMMVLDEYIIMPNHVHGIIVLYDTVGARHAVPLQKQKNIRKSPLDGGMNSPAASSGVSKNLNSVIPHLMRNPESKAKRVSTFLLVPDAPPLDSHFRGNDVR